tara:strand:+ start:1463 stop:1732 length:270 start_codon:yes stop_codon:yes gene_type:complete
MAEQYDNTNRGAVWKNNKKETEKHPDLTGSLNVNGQEFWVSAWKRQAGANEKSPVLSLSIKAKEDSATSRQATASSGSSADNFDEDIPF